MAKRRISLYGVRIKRQDDEPRTQRAYVEMYGAIEGLKTEPIAVTLITEERAILLAEELLTAARQMRKHNG